MTAEAATRAPAGEAGFHLLGEHLPNLVLLAFDLEPRIWAATGAALRARGWTAGHFVGKRVPEVDELLWQVTKDLSTEVTSLRRTIGRLRPLVLVEDGLEAALREEAKSACNRAALVACEVTSELDGRLDPVVETAQFRVAQQALVNVVDHAGANRALVAIECVPSGVVLRVSDDSRGFDPDHVRVLADVAHFGLIAMRERVEALGGRFRVTTAPGQGTVVEARLPPTDPAEWRWGA